MTKRRAMTAVLTLVAAVLGLVTAPPAGAAPTTSSVSVVQALKGLSVDLYLDGFLAATAFQPRSVAGPLNLSAADHRFQAFLPVANPPVRTPVGPTPLIDSVIAVPAGLDLSLVIHPARVPNGTGLPVLSTFVNDTSFVGAGRSRFQVRHAANLGNIDIRSNDIGIGTDIALGGHAETVVPKGETALVVFATGTTTNTTPHNDFDDAFRALMSHVVAQDLYLHAQGPAPRTAFTLVSLDERARESRIIGTATIAPTTAKSVVGVRTS